MPRSSAFALCVLITLIGGCVKVAPNGSTETPPAVESILLTETQVASVRHAVEACGGTLQLDDRGQPTLIDLAVDRGSADEAGLRAALECTNLKTLRIRAAGAPAGLLAEIGKLTQLEELYLQNVSVDNSLLAQTVGRLPHLRQLTLRNTPGLDDITPIATRPKLTHLALIDQPIVGEHLSTLLEASQLVSLDLRMCSQLGGKDIASLSHFPRLKSLKLGEYGIDNESMDAVAKIKTLENLTIEDAAIDGGGLTALTPIASQIRTLRLSRCASLDDDAMQVTKAFTQLRVLLLRDLPVTGEFLANVHHPEHLDTLTLRQLFLGDEAFDAIANCKNLKRLNLADNYLDPTWIEIIATLPKLETLDLSRCGLDKASVLLPLKQLPHLRTLNLSGNSDISEETTREILESSQTDAS
ncbi:leucine-rich repeat domain-containing protein [Rhodopirellula sallentina]|uniref:Leucine-rich repeat-containing protein n=1 Tax=Rhodopirellula sallentina SM41 TaxID=1263870 RepID=M5U8K6_9BACT|nr:leucine-rich repeat domain-containing protein [Rhodopirellula sallentina]EMI57765.1 leucine-rich repeat-containing protein [Rhodopirellula sallentina SM41]